MSPGMEWKDDAFTTMSAVSLTQNTSTSNTTIGSIAPPSSMTGATIASPIIMFMSGVIGNLLALVVLHRTRLEAQRLMFHSLVAGLVWNDLIGIVLTSPVTIASYINGVMMPGGEHLCRFNGFVMICFGLSTPLIVSAMAIERFLFVKYTFFYTKHCAPSAARLVMLAIWGFVLFFGLLPMFGFGDYVLQYPKTWCFLDFRTTNPVHAAYGYLYSGLNLLLVLVMVVCNLVVVVTLARVRDYRRKYSSCSSLNSVLIAEGAMDDTQRQQAMARRRKQKDIELQMIVVMCAITTIFAVCWIPLMLYISMTLAMGGQTANFLGLVAIRLASLNQTLNPWLYVILRRALIIRVKKYCCRWRKYLRKSNLSPTPVMRRQQYVHVRNQLCHRNNFVGGNVNSESLSDSMRKSLQQAIPAAMSLPDVMMVNTGYRGLDMPLPDVARAETFAGRVSHSYSMNSIISCAYCNNPAVVGCVDCLTERYAAARMASKVPNMKSRKYAVNEEYPICPYNSKISDDHQEVKLFKHHILYSKKQNSVAYTENSKTAEGHKNNNSKGNALEISDISRDALVCSKHSSHSKHFNRDQDLPLSGSKADIFQKKKEKEPFSMTSSIARGSSLHGRSQDSRFSQHMHKTRNSSKSSSTKTSSSKGRPVSRQSGSADVQMCNIPGSERHQARTDSVKSSHSVKQDHIKLLLNESVDSDNVFQDSMDITCIETHKDTTTTTDDVGFSSLQTDSMYLSDSRSPDVQLFKSDAQLFKVKRTANGNLECNHVQNLKDVSDPTHSDVVVQDQPQNTAHSNLDKERSTVFSRDSHHRNTLQPQQTNLSRLMISKDMDQNKISRPSCTNNAYNVNSVDNNSCLMIENSEDESERSSGIFSTESPAKNSKDLVFKPKFQVKKEAQSEPTNEMTSLKKETARRVKSCK